MRNARQIREDNNLTLEDVARRTSVRFSHLAAFERGEVGMGLEKMQELAAFYGCTLDELVAETPALGAGASEKSA